MDVSGICGMYMIRVDAGCLRLPGYSYEVATQDNVKAANCIMYLVFGVHV